MCGPDNSNRPRGGALAALNPPINTTTTSNLCADLAFHTPGCPGSSNATHARLTPGDECDINNLSDLRVVIHSSGDMTRKATDCGLFRHFALPNTRPTPQDTFVELPLERPLSIEVGNDGIIGRRVSLYSRLESGQVKIVAEGIVGFNFLSEASSPAPSSPSPSI